jgi:hypothetical protein
MVKIVGMVAGVGGGVGAMVATVADARVAGATVVGACRLVAAIAV